jgi:hypothetical protein
MRIESRSQVGYFPGEVIRMELNKLAPGWLGTVPYADLPRRAEFYSTEEEWRAVPPSLTSKKDWNSFQHYKAVRGPAPPSSAMQIAMRMWEYEPNIYTGFAHHWRTGIRPVVSGSLVTTPFGEPGMPVQGLPKFLDPDSEGNIVPPPAELSRHNKAALASMLPGIKAGLSAINSTIELKDFASLPRAIKSAAIFAIKNRKALAKIVRAIAIEVGDPRFVSGSYLQLKFNIQPLISDIMGVHRALATVEEKLRQLINGAGRPQHRHFSRMLLENGPIADSSDYGHIYRQPEEIGAFVIDYSFSYLLRDTIQEPTLFHAEIDYNYTLSQFQLEHARVLALMDSVGINLNPAIVWNAIPFSFVVDWLLNVSSWLGDRKRLNMEPKINIRRYLWSVKRKRKVFLKKSFFSNQTYLPPQSQTTSLPTIFETAYRRDVGQVDSGTLEVSGLNSREFTLGLALGTVMVKKPRRRRW